MPPVACGIRTSNRRKQAAADPRLRRRGRRCRPVCTLEAYVYTNFDRPFMVSNNTTSVSQGTQPVCNACLAPHVCLYFASRLFLLVRRPHFSVFVYVHVRWFHFVPVYLHRPKLAPERYKRPRLRMDPKRSVCHKRASGQLWIDSTVYTDMNTCADLQEKWINVRWQAKCALFKFGEAQTCRCSHVHYTLPRTNLCSGRRSVNIIT
jgi:hypothetical protein